MIQATINGKIPSKSNCYKIGTLKGKGILYKSAALKRYESNFLIQLPPKYRGLKISDFFKLSVDVFYPSNRSDLDNSLKILLDCLQDVTKTIKNDNKCIEIQARKAIDAKEPRIEFKIETK